MYNFFGHGQTLEEFIPANLWRGSVTEIIADRRIDHVLHLETLPSDFHKLPFVHKRCHIPRWTVSTKRRVILAMSAISYVKQRYADDFSNFGYDPEDLSCFGLKIYL